MYSKVGDIYIKDALYMYTSCVSVLSNYKRLLLLILQSFDWLAAFHLELLQAILFIAVCQLQCFW